MISNIWNLTCSIVTELPTVTLATHNGNAETSALRDALVATVTVVQVGSYTRSPTTISGASFESTNSPTSEHLTLFVLTTISQLFKNLSA